MGRWVGTLPEDDMAVSKGGSKQESHPPTAATDQEGLSTELGLLSRPGRSRQTARQPFIATGTGTPASLPPQPPLLPPGLSNGTLTEEAVSKGGP